VPRPVFRGLRPGWAWVARGRDHVPLQCRDPFSGDCDGALWHSS